MDRLTSSQPLVTVYLLSTCGSISFPAWSWILPLYAFCLLKCIGSSSSSSQSHRLTNTLTALYLCLVLVSGIFFNIKSDTKLKIRLIHNTSENFTVFQNNFINFNKNCEVQLEDHFNLTNNSINNINYNIHIDESAVIKHSIFQNFANSNKLYLTSNSVCEKNSFYNQNTYNFSDGFVRNFHHAHLNGEYSNASLKGCFFLKNKNICSNKTNIIHNAENCVSDQTYKGILNDHSKASYYSNTFVSENAQKTEGYQLSKGILLTDDCSFFSKPELRIFADDVKCSHGSTIGPVDESALYYLR